MNQGSQEMIPAEILVVDDIPANLKLLTDILRERGYRVRPAPSGHLALRSAALKLPDLILLDVKMPDMDGYEVCQALKSDKKSRDIPVIFISALHETSDKVRGLEAGGVDFITKPFQAEEVLARVKTHLALHRLHKQLERQNTQLQREMAERRQAEEALRLQSEFLEILLETIPTPIFYKGADGKYTGCNKAFERFLGRPRQEIIGKTVYDMGPKEIADRYSQKDKELFDHPGEQHYEWRVQRKDGEIRDVIFDKAAIIDTKGCFDGLIGVITDITERRQAEDALLKSETKFRALFENANDAIFLVKEDVFIDCNPRTLQMFQCTKDQIIGQSPYRFSPPLQADGCDSKEKTLEKLRAASAGTPQSFEWKHCQCDGTPFDAEVSLNSVELGGEPFIQAIVRDITDRKQSEEALNRQMRLAALGAEIGFVLTRDDDMRAMLQQCTEAIVRYMNVAVARIWTLNEDEKVLELQASAGMYTHLNGHQARIPVGSFKIGLIAQEKRPLVTNAVTGDFIAGDSEWAEREQIVAFVGYPLVVEDKLVGVVAAFSRNEFDETMPAALATIADEIAIGIGRKNLEDALVRSVSLLSATLESTADGILVVDRAGKTANFNARFKQMWHIPDDVMASKDDDQLLAFVMNQLSNPDEFIARVRALYCQPEAGCLDIINFKSGSIFERYSRPQRIGADIVGRVWSFRDITERKRAEEEKVKTEAQNRQLQKAESLGRMAGAIAHHFNNQLGVVMGNLELAMIDLPQLARPQANLSAAMKACHRAAEVSGLMLTYLGQRASEREPVDLSEVCHRGLPMLRAAMPKDLTLATDLPFPGPTLSADTNQIQQALTNLVTNAWEAVDDDWDTIHLSVKTVFSADIPATNRFPIDWQPQDNTYACLEVADAGCGIADKDIERLFDPFFSTKFTGRGLGLSVVLGIVRAHGGAVTVESEPGGGSVFRVFFPVLAEDIPRQREIAAKAPELEGGATVLVVEDEETLRNMAEAMLTHLGFKVLAAKDGVEAVQMFRQHQDEIRCVLCDLTMPRMNGWETLAALRKFAPDIPVILASGYDKAQVMAGDHPEWPQAFLSKPYQLKELSEAIRHAVVNTKK
jgi:PAS domain S-box-containing protein